MGNEQSGGHSRGASGASSEAEDTVTASNKKQKRKDKSDRRSRKPHQVQHSVHRQAQFENEVASGGGGFGGAVQVHGDAAAHHPPVAMEASANTFGAAHKPDKKTAARAAAANTTSNPTTSGDQVMITDALSDVRLQYHINPKEIGHGHYGVVRKCMHRQTKEWYAIKSIRKSKVGKIGVLKREIAILKEVRHPNIIRLIEVHEDQKYLHLITELCTGGELFDRIIAKTQSSEGHFSENDAAGIIRCILDAIAYCHNVNVVHRDLKPENFLFKTEAEDADIKIIDFGLSRHDDQNFGVMKTKVGTPYYVAPEVLNRQYTKSCDIWSIGVITYILLCGYPPFYGDNDNQIFDSVRAGRFDFPSPDWDTISSAAKDFICSLLRKEPSKRLSASEALRHKWILEQTQHSSKWRSSSVQYKSGRSVTFKNFVSMQKLKKAALGYIANNLSKAEVENLEGIFRKIDRSGNGIVTLKEVDDALENCNFPSDLQAELRRLREDLSLSGGSTINWRDFSAAMMDKSLARQEDKIRMAFEHFKKSTADDKCLQISDLVDIFGGEAQAREIMGEMGYGKDGRISYEEFHKMMMMGSFNEG